MSRPAGTMSAYVDSELAEAGLEREAHLRTARRAWQRAEGAYYDTLAEARRTYDRALSEYRSETDRANRRYSEIANRIAERLRRR